MPGSRSLETIRGLANDGKTNEKSAPNLLQMAVVAREYEEEFRLVKPPWLIQRVLLGVLGPLARLLGSEVLIPGTALRSRRLFRGRRVGRMSPASGSGDLRFSRGPSG